ncbi:Leucine-rich repeat serine/threonine-protein kinase 2, partial [Phlyctochytrium planicorne]
MGDQDPMQTAVIPSSQITIDSSECLGSGAVGAVYKARYANETVVVKKLKLTSLSQRAREEFKQEAWTLSKLNHPRIVRFLGVILDDQYCIVLEYLRHGSLYSFYTAHEKIPFSNRMSLAVDIASGMDFLHRLNPPVLHRD